MSKVGNFAIGVMSGTSLDGVDLVYVHFQKQAVFSYEILACETILYSPFWESQLRSAIAFSEGQLLELDRSYGVFLGDTIATFIKKNKITKLDFIASHGHTVLHEPKKGVTLQVGSGLEIARITKHKVVCDFRTQDVALGGEGAPLVPIGDALLFSDYEYCINLGGFSNVSFQKDDARIAFDICPVNIVLNFYANKLGLSYDDKGSIAEAGNLDNVLLQKLNALSFYEQTPPKSLGLEWVQKEILPILESSKLEIKTILNTFCEHIACQIGNVIPENSNVLFTGGGVFNQYLMKRIAHHASISVKLPSANLIDYKEALIFAFLGLLRIDNQVNCLKSVTGARKNHSSGVIFLP